MHQNNKYVAGLALAALASAPLLGTSSAAAAPASDATTGKTVVLSAPHKIPTRRHVTPVISVAATTDQPAFAVYARYNPRGGIPFDSTGELVKVTAKHRSTTFGTITSDMTTFSSATGEITAGSRRNPHTVYSWNPGASKQPATVGTVPVGDRYLAAAPGGWVDVDADGNLRLQPAGSATTTTLIAHPFSADSGDGIAAIAGPTGLVVSNGTDLAFVSFDGNTVTPLDTSMLPASGPGFTNSVACWSASSSAVACGIYYFDGEDDSGLKNTFIDPLDGGASYAHTADHPRVATMLGRVAGFLDRRGHLAILRSAGISTSKGRFMSSPVAGLGGFLEGNPAQDTGVLVTKKFATTVELPPVNGVSEARSFAIDKGSVVWRADDHGAKAGYVVHRRSVGSNSSHSAVTAGPRHTVGISTSATAPLAVSGATTVYGTSRANSPIGQGSAITLRIVTASGHQKVTNVDRYKDIAVGDHRVLFYAATDAAPPMLYNLKTHKTKTVPASVATLSGHYLAAYKNGTITQKNLDTGKVATVADGLINDQYAKVTVFEHGSVVGWNYRLETEAFLTQHAGYREMDPASDPVTLPSNERIWALTGAGLITEPIPGKSFSLRPYGSDTETTLLTGNDLVAGPEIGGGVVAWIDQFGRLKARALTE